jgi:cyclophilin family peptidyl-prolyl cis-trans isomerase
LIFVGMFSASFGFAQKAASTPPGQKADPAKVNGRPTPTPPVLVEPFEKADIKTMAAQCVRLITDAGDIELELYPETAPESVRNFLDLAAIGAFDTTTFSRVVPRFVIQGGNLGTRELGITSDLAKRARRVIPDEPNQILHERGIVSMARSDESNTATTHFFILVNSASYLDGKYAAFGRVTKGMEVVDAINSMPVEVETPLKPVRIKKAIVNVCTAANARPAQP